MRVGFIVVETLDDERGLGHGVDGADVEGPDGGRVVARTVPFDVKVILAIDVHGQNLEANVVGLAVGPTQLRVELVH